ncbi:hypothetical protein N5P37_005647 [Trichoderma harzianum]|nr:hypothetical protein N5P37_005647 [Trichoderma harzianum]
MEDAYYDPALFYDVELDFRTPRLESNSASPIGQSQQRSHSPSLPLLQLSDWDEDLLYDEFPPTCIHYSIEWDLRLNTGKRLMKLMYNPELEQDLVLAPGAYWDKSWKKKLEDRLKKKTPATKCYEPEEANFVISVSDRAETNFSKSYPDFDINWKEVEKQLQIWSPLFRGGRKLHIKVVFVYKPSVPSASMSTRSSTRRRGGATGRQHAELEAEQAEDEAAGRPNHWSKVYAIMQCDGPPCSGTQCFRDPERGNKHFPADGDIMQELVTYSEEGNKFEDQKDVPQFIHDMIYKKDRLNEQRKESSKKRKRRDSFIDSYPIHITNVLPGPSNQASAVALTGPPKDIDVDEWDIPEPRDDAIELYGIFHCARVSSDIWKASIRKAVAFTFQQGLDLKYMYMCQQQCVEIFVNAGILPGIAESWVRDVKKWVDKVNNGTT